MWALPISSHALSHKRVWMLEVLPSCFQGEPLTVLSNTLVTALCSTYTHLTKKVKYEVGLTVTSLLSPLYFKMWDTSCSCLFSSCLFSFCVLYFVFLHSQSLVLRVDRKKRKNRKSETRCHLISFAIALTWIGFPSHLEFVILMFKGTADRSRHLW